MYFEYTITGVIIWKIFLENFSGKIPWKNFLEEF